MPRPSRLLLAALACAGAAALCAGCGPGAAGSGGRTVAVATTTQAGDLLRAVAGERAAVRQLLAPNSDPHAYEPRPSDVRAVTGADVVVRSGGDVDGWLGGVLDNAGSKAAVVDLIDAVRTRRVEGGVDPHWWQDPRNAEIAVRRIRAALSAADPGGRAAYAANARRELARLRRLDAAIAACMDAIPAQQRKLVTDHDALGYYADRYGIEVIGTVIPALSTQAQASAGAVARLARTIRAAHVGAIFSERSVNPKLEQAIARDSGARLGAPLYADTLGPAGSPGATLVGALRSNTRALAAGFTGGRARCQL
jgi:ABC-type Zn uptake system ZnuABC Zn-binding protein ZnuA